jgi:hypothetical protein
MERLNHLFRLEADKKTVQAQRYEGRGFFGAGDLPGGAARNELSGKT